MADGDSRRCGGAVNPEHVTAEFERALQSLHAAQLLHPQALYADAVSRAYYAVMHAAKAALLAHDVIVESHAALKRLFGSELVRARRIEPHWAEVLAREQRRGIAADYDPAEQVSEEASRQLVDDAHSFVERMRQYLVDSGFLASEGGGHG